MTIHSSTEPSRDRPERPRRRGPDAAPPAPRWMKVLGLIVLLFVLLLVVVAVFNVGGPHGPNRHIPASDDPGTHGGSAGWLSLGTGLGVR